jgi:Spy/CpxP family protein refolding chaperone
MRKVRGFLLGGAVLALSMIPASLIPVAAYGQANPGEPGTGRPRMHRMFGVEAPWVSIALRHQKDLGLSPDQVATLEKIRNQYRDQSTPIQEQLRTTESDLAVSLQETPANLIQAKLKIEEVEKLRAQLRYLRVEALENGKSVLTAQQRDQLKNLVAARHPGFKKPQGQPS